MKSRVFHGIIKVMVAGVIFVPVSLMAQQGLSHVRVVRLSYVSGTVAIKRPASTEWAKAMVNTPLQEGFALSTSSNSFAEVEFENGSTARLGELSKIEFSQLAMDTEGNKLNRLTFEQGYATFHFIREHKDEYTVKAADAIITPGGKSEFRTDLEQNQLRVEVLSGSVDVKGPAESAQLGKGKVLHFDTQTAEAFNIQNGIEKDSWDKWTEARDQQTLLARNDSPVGLNRSLYGWSDLDAYGDWAFFPGYGNGWAPFEPAGWSPYSAGLWNWYPSFGWTWISGDPWGWVPYHYGLWNYDRSFGWFWMPNGFGDWSTALVSWYSGPGWIGWSPYGVNGQSCGNYNCVTAVPGGVLQNGQPINSQNVITVHAGQGTPINRPRIRPEASAMLSGIPLSQSAALPRGNMTQLSRAPQTAPGAAPNAFSSGAFRTRSMPAPRTVLMGNNPKSEAAILNNRPGFWARALGVESQPPLRVHLGPTMGGSAPRVYGSGLNRAELGGMRDSQVMNRSGMGASSRGYNRPAPVVLPHGNAGGFPRGASDGGMMRGGFDGAARSNGGGVYSGSSAAPAPMSTVSAPSSPRGGTVYRGHR
ncbi:MAG TPA: DUF6600 domain-containing protein [Terriglobia bacterium]|nr:DUF6600 domain-containing protein [Terriglobia bacterium]